MGDLSANGTTSTAISFESSARFGEFKVPTFDGSSEFSVYERDITLWQLVSSLDASKQGAAVVGGLSGAAKMYCATVTVEELKSDTGVATLLNHLRAGFGVQDVAKQHAAISDWLDYGRKPGQNMTDFIVSYPSKTAKINLEMNNDLQGHLLLRRGKFSRETIGIIVATAGGSYAVEKITNAIKTLWPNGTELPECSSTSDIGNGSSYPNGIASTGTGPTNTGGRNKQRPFCTHCTTVGHTTDTCWKRLLMIGDTDRANEIKEKIKKSRNRRNGKTNGKSDTTSSGAGQSLTTARDDLTFFMPWTALTPSAGHKFGLFALIDTGAITSIMGKQTLDSFMTTMNISNVPSQSPNHNSHSFGVDGTPKPVAFTTRIPWTIGGHSDKDKNATLKIHFSVDIIDGDCPFILGTPALAKLCATISFGTSGDAAMKVKVANTTLIIDLVPSGAHFLLPFHGTPPAGTNTLLNKKGSSAPNNGFITTYTRSDFI